MFVFQDWKNTLLAADAELDAENKHGLTKATGKPESSAKEDALDCLAGSYRKLDI